MSAALEPLDYSVRTSRRARRARIVVRPNLSVEVVLPHGVAQHHAHALVAQKRQWVENSLERFREDYVAADSQPFPDRIDMPAIGQSFRVVYNQSGSRQLRVSEKDGQLSLSGDCNDPERVANGLRRWLKRKAGEVLLTQLAELADRHGFQYRTGKIRLQKSRWGSCSRAGIITLNAKLLFLSPELARYVIIHELSHLERLDHSPKFWAVVDRCDAGYREHRRKLRRSGGSIPGWVEA